MKYEEIIEKIISGSIDIGLKIIAAIIVLAIGLRVIKWIEKLIKKENKYSRVDKSMKSFIVSFASIGLKIVLFIFILNILGVPLASMLGIISSCAIAVGLALQGGLSNIAGGVMIMIFKPFKEGDYIIVNGNEGTVKETTLFYTTITTPDNKTIQLPNGNLSNSDITNVTGCTKRRVDIELSVSYDSDIEKVKEIIQTEIDNHELILKDEDIVVRMKDMADSALIFVARVWVLTDDYWTVNFDLKESIKKSFDKNHIEIPFPQVDVHMKK